MFVNPAIKKDICSPVNISKINNLDIVTCYSSPQDHCVTRGFMNECAPTVNAAAGMSGNNRPFIVKICDVKVKAFGIDQQGGKGGANYTEDVAPTICSDSHGTPHAVCRIYKSPIVLNFQGSKGNNVVSQDETCPTLNSMHGHDVHVVCVSGRTE
jgi:hypothetical protein